MSVETDIKDQFNVLSGLETLLRLEKASLGRLYEEYRKMHSVAEGTYSIHFKENKVFCGEASNVLLKLEKEFTAMSKGHDTLMSILKMTLTDKNPSRLKDVRVSIEYLGLVEFLNELGVKII